MGGPGRFVDRVSLGDRLARRLRLWLLGDPLGDRGALVSMVHGGDAGRASERLVQVALDAAGLARHEDLRAVSDRIAAGPRWPDLWPGEHYRLLAALVRVLAPATVVEIGTYQGLAALALARNLPAGGHVVTFDVVPWRDVRGTALRDADLADGRIVPVCADLTRADTFEAHRATLEASGLVFVDAAKDGRVERVLLERFETLRFARPPVVVLDDIRVWNMLRIWRDVRRPKLDLCSFGHWSGTGLIDWQPAS